MGSVTSQGLKGKGAMITGGARTIGLAIAKALASRGAAVAIADICHDLETIPYRLSSMSDLNRAVEEISALGTTALGLTCDVRSEDQVQATVQRVIEEFGHLDILINNAGVISGYPDQ